MNLSIMNIMKIVEIIPFLSQGGAQRFVVDLSNKLVDDGHDVTIVSLMSLEKYGLFLGELKPQIKVVSTEKKIGFDFRQFFKLFLLIHRMKPDVVHSHLRALNYLILSIIIFRQIKFIHTVHNDASKEAVDKFSVWVRKLCFGFLRVKPVTISEESKRSFTDFYHVDSTLIYNGRPKFESPSSDTIDMVCKELGRLKEKPENLVIVNVARLGVQKNQPMLVRAIDNINKREYVNIDLIIIGATDEAHIKNEIEAIGSVNVHLLGTKMNPRDYMAAADAFCLSSIYEGMPITLIECFSVGAIPICTPVGGVVDMIQDGKNGILAKGTSQIDMEEALTRFLKMTDAEIAEMKRHSQESYKYYDMKTCADKYENLMRVRQ